MKTLQYRLILSPEPEGGYTVKVPAIRGCITYGETVEEAIAMTKDAIEGCLEVLKEEGQPILPDDSQTFEYSLNLTTELVVTQTSCENSGRERFLFKENRKSQPSHLLKS